MPRAWTGFVGVALVAASAFASRAPATKTLVLGTPLARFRLLVPATHFYLRYTVVGDRRMTLDIWRRSVSFEDREGRRVGRVSQRWDGVGEKKYTVLKDSWFEPDTFRPLSHESRADKEGKLTVTGFRFLDHQVVGMPELEDSSTKDFALEMSLPAYNFETDVELLQTLPLDRGYEVRVPFYDPGLDPPAWYTFRVTGEERVPGPDGRGIDCWVVSTDYNQPDKYRSQFWLAKKTQVLLRQQTWMPDGSLLVKTLLNGEGARETS